MFDYSLLTENDKKTLARWWDLETTQEALHVFNRLILANNGELIALDDTDLIDNRQVGIKIAKLKGARELLVAQKNLSISSLKEFPN